jgi:vitamin B12 transporter
MPAYARHEKRPLRQPSAVPVSDTGRTVIGLAALSLSAATAPTSAQTAQPLETVIISGTRTPVPSTEVGSTLTIVTGEELETRQIRIVSDALRAVPGLAVSRSGPLGTFTQVRIRGAEANQTVVMIDGIKVNDPFTSEVDFAHLLTAEIDRIEVLRGPQSVLYGSEAIGGVISIFTKRGAPGSQFQGNLEGGSFSTVNGSIAARGASREFSYAVAGAGLRSDGTNISRFGNEDDGYRNATFLGNAAWTPTPDASVAANLRYRDSRTEFDPQDFSFPPGPTYGLVIDGDRKTDGTQLDARVIGKLATGALVSQLAATYTNTDASTYADGRFTNGSEGTRSRYEYLGTYSFIAGDAPQALSLSLEHENLRFQNIGPTPTSAQNQTQTNNSTGIAGEYRVRLPSHTAVSASVRRDLNSLFQDATTYRFTVAQPVGGGISLRASYGKGVANPTFFELFGFIPGQFDPNPALKPEESRGFDLGIDFAIGTTSMVALTYFNADLENEIAGTFDSTTFRSSVQNLQGTSKRRGIELEARYSPSPQWTLGGTYTYLSSKQPDGQPEVRRPRNVASAAVTYNVPNALGSVTLAVDYNGSQQDLDFSSFGGARAMMPSYTLVRLAGQYALSRQVSLTARIENLLDEDYEEVYSFRASGIAFFAGVQARF